MVDRSDSILWQRMATEEMRREARRRGMKLSDLEEERALSVALQESATIGQSPATNNTATSISAGISHPTTAVSITSLMDRPSLDKSEQKSSEEGNIEDDDALPDHDHLPTTITSTTTAGSNVTGTDIVVTTATELSIWQTSLPQEITNKILLLLLDPDMCGYISCIAKTNPFRPSEMVYRVLCEHIYGSQCRKKQLVVANWGGTWRNMLVLRPRLRTNGFYCLRTLYSRAPCHDNFWEEKKVQSVECKFYRYLRFMDHGKVLYSLETTEPELLARCLCRGIGVPKRVFEGTYSVCRREVSVMVEMHYAIVYFTLHITNSDDGFEGSFNTLRIQSHSSSALVRGGTVTAGERVEHRLPGNCDMQFWRYWDWIA